MIFNQNSMANLVFNAMRYNHEIGVILKLPPLKQVIASKQFKSIYLDKLLSNKSAKRV